MGKGTDDFLLDNKNCPLIGFLTESVRGLYQSTIWIGASDTAIKNNYGFICFAGGSLYSSSWDPFEPQRNVIYNLLDLNRIQGLIISGSLGSFIPSQEFQDFCHKFKSIPMVCIGPEVTSLPRIMFDNMSGMRALISHLVTSHSCRRIAFIRGPEGNEEAEQRLFIFREVLREHNISLIPELIVSGDFSRDAGAKAVKYLIDERNESFDALVGANDDMALGALKAFQERHIRVPDQVLVVGFDDIEESSYSTPPITTVRQPLYEIGSKAVNLLIDLIEKRTVPEIVVVPAVMELRQSCGCYRFESVSSFTDKALEGKSLQNLKDILHDQIASIFNQMRNRCITAAVEQEIESLTDVFYGEITNDRPGRFLPAINKMAWRIASGGGDAPGLLKTITILRKFCTIYFKNNVPDQIEDLLKNADLGIADAASRVQAHRRMEAERQWMLLRASGQAIASAFDFDSLLDVINSELVKLDIDNFSLSLYSEPIKSLDSKTCILAIKDGKINTCANNLTFNNPAIAPPDALQLGVPGSYLVEPLFFKNEQLGFITFNIADCRDGLTYEIFRQYISSALKGALLMKKVQEQSLALETANVQLQKLRDTEHAYLEAIKHELELGREIQGSFLPRELPKINGWEIDHAFAPAREVSGDFYDVFTLPTGQIALIIADVSGKDVGAALFMVLIRTLIRSLSEVIHYENSTPLDTIQLTNNYLINHHYGNNGRYMYATLFMAILDQNSNKITYINAGHNPPAIINAQGGVQKWIETTGPAVGIIPEGQFVHGKLQLEPGEMLFTYTDGVTEARDTKGTLFSKKKLASLFEMPFSSASEAVKIVESAVNNHCEGLAPHDDITMLVLRRKG